MLVIFTLLLLFVLGKQDNLKMVKRFETILELAVSCEEFEKMKITTEFRNFPQLPEFPEEKQTTFFLSFIKRGDCHRYSNRN
jgi:hypothetical protein